MATKYVYFFGNEQADGDARMKDLLGGKGANLAEMTKIGIPVPPGFTITSDVCDIYYKNNGVYPEELKLQINESVTKLENIIGAKFGGKDNPLLVSVRSGARVSMPGMMDTILNVGLNDSIVQGLAKKTNNGRFAYDCYRRFIETFGNVALGMPGEILLKIIDEKKQQRKIKLDSELTLEDIQEIIKKMKATIKQVSGKDFPEDPMEQLWGAVSPVFESWNNPRAIAYREMNKIPHIWGTAVNVQAMVFGNMGETSGTGVAFSRNPSTGEKKVSGEFLLDAQGEDIVAGVRTPQPISELGKVMPECHKAFLDAAEKLERHFREMQDIEFTVQNKKLWILQTRTGKRTGAAAVKIAIDMVDEGMITINEALLRVSPDALNQLLHPVLDPKAKKEVIARGLPASPGAVSGKLLFDSDEASAFAEQGGDCILARQETSADDIRGIQAAAGLLTTRGGMTSHAAVVARGMGKCCVVGCSEAHIDQKTKKLTIGDKVFNKGDFLTLNGSTGEVIVGRIPTIIPRPGAEFKKFMSWADSAKKLGVLANADNPNDAKFAREMGAEGIGLCRTEHMFFQKDRVDAFRQVILAEKMDERKNALATLLDLQRNDFSGMLKEMEGLPVVIRLLDPPLHEFLPSPHDKEELETLAERLNTSYEKLQERVGQLKEFNPMLGHRGSRMGITHPEIYEMQVRAIIEASCDLIKQGHNIFPEIMLPVIGMPGELKILKKLIKETGDKVIKEKGLGNLNYKIGIMIELPAAALGAQKLAEEADFFSFGTNDLTQTTLGLSRDDAGTFIPSYLEKGILKDDPFQTISEAGVGDLVKIGVKEGRKAKPHLKIGVCGEHGGDPVSIKFFHATGLDYVSCSPYRVPIARLAAAQATLLQQE